MGDGGVACMPLQQHNIMDKTLCGGKSSGGNVLSSKLLKLADGSGGRKKKKKKMKQRKEDPVRKVSSELGLDKVSKRTGEVENGDICAEKVQKDEVEEGELGTLKWPRSDLENGEFVPDMLPPPPPPPRWRSEIESGEIVSEKWKTRELGKGEIAPGKWEREDLERGEVVPEKGRKGEAEKGEYGFWRGMKDDLEKGEFIPDRWYKGEMGKDDYNSRIRRYHSGREKAWKSERDRTPPSGRYAADDFLRKKELNRSGSQHAKSSPSWESGQQRSVRISSKIVDEGKNVSSNGKDHSRDYNSGSRMKRLSNDCDGSERKHSGDYGGLKSRRLSDDFPRHGYSDNYSRRSVERSYRGSNSSKLSADKYSSRNHESSLSTRQGYDRHGHSPGHSERSPREQARYYDHRDRTPLRRSPCGRDRSPYSRDKSPRGRERSPYERNWDRSRQHDHKFRSPTQGVRPSSSGRDRSPYSREKSPHGRERSPHERNWDRSRQHDHKFKSPTHANRSPQDRGRHHDRRDRTPNLVEGSPLDGNRKNSNQETSCKTLPSEKHNSQYNCKEHEDKHIQSESNCSGAESQGERNVHETDGSTEKDICSQPVKQQQACSPTVSYKESPHIEPVPEELPSMEEDMDICDTPPHVPVVTDSSSGRWFYLDYGGVENGPAKLSDIKVLVDEGVLMSDHFIKHLDSDRWLTVENASSPLTAQTFPSIVSDTITQLVNPPEAPGNLLADTGDILQSGPESCQEMPATSLRPLVCPDDNVLTSELLEDLHIDERVRNLLEGYDVIPGMELEAIKGNLSCR